MKYKFNLVVFAGYSVLVTVLSLLPKSAAIAVPNDKAGHLLAYSVFAVLGFRLVSALRPYFFLCIGILFYGALMELGQSFVPGREMSALDIVANSSGVAIGALLCLYLPGLLKGSPKS